MKKTLIALTAVFTLATLAQASIVHSWVVTTTSDGNIRSDLYVDSSVKWTNSHIEIDTPLGEQIHFGSGNAAHIDNTLPAFADDTGSFPGDAAVAFHAESAMYTETDWGVPPTNPFDTDASPIYSVTLAPDANYDLGVLVRSFNVDAEDVTETFPIVNGAVTPEPASLLLLALGALTLRRR